MTKKSTAELQAEAKDLRKRLEALKAIEAAKKERSALEKEVQDLHRSTSLKWKILKKSGSVGKAVAKDFGKFVKEELIDDEKPKTKEEKEEEGESLL